MSNENTIMTLHRFCHQHKGGELIGIITAEQAVHETHYPTAIYNTSVSNIGTDTSQIC